MRFSCGSRPGNPNKRIKKHMKAKLTALAALTAITLLAAPAHADKAAPAMTKEAQQSLTPAAALKLLQDGNARVAGNIVNTDILGGLEFASKLAGAKVIAVIGHTSCGAIKGACGNVELGKLTALIDKMEPAVEKTSAKAGEYRSSKNDAFADRVAETNVKHAIETIRKDSPLLAQMAKDGQLQVVGGIYASQRAK